MDYCSSCRRHLNGALVCPGCGAYAPAIAPVTADGRTVPAPGAMPVTARAAVNARAARELTASDTRRQGRLRDEATVAAGTVEAPQAGPSGDVEGATPAPQGRAARRRQLARWKKNKRRAVVATAVALVGGGLTVATMDQQSNDRTQAATAPKDPSTGTAEEQGAERPRPTPTRPATPRPSRTPATKAPTASPPRGPAVAAKPRTTPPNVRPDAVVTPRPTPTSVPQQRTVSPTPDATAPDRSGTAAEQPPAPPAADGTDPDTSQPSPAPSTTAPQQLCVLVVCLG
jgi:hypothetical protein